MTDAIRPDGFKPPVGPLSYGRVAGSLLFISGQGPIDGKTGSIVLGSFEEQAVLTLQNVDAVVKAAGGTLRDVVKINVFLGDIENVHQFNDVYRRFFARPYPSRTTVGAQLGRIAIEIDAVALLPSTLEEGE